MKRVLLVVGGQKLTDPFDGPVNILARATQSLSRFDLDFSGRSVGSVTVNGAPASFRRDGQELIITPRTATYDIRFDVPARYTAIAKGVQVLRRSAR